MLNLWHIIAKICTIAVFVIVDLQSECCAEFVGTFVIHLHVTFHVPSCNFPFVIVMSSRIELFSSHHFLFLSKNIALNFNIFEGLFSYVISQLFMKRC